MSDRTARLENIHLARIQTGATIFASMGAVFISVGLAFNLGLIPEIIEKIEEQASAEYFDTLNLLAQYANWLVVIGFIMSVGAGLNVLAKTREMRLKIEFEGIENPDKEMLKKADLFRRFRCRKYNYDEYSRPKFD